MFRLRHGPPMSGHDLVEELRRRQRWVIPYQELVPLCGLPPASARVLFHHLVRRGLLERPCRGWYARPGFLPEAFATVRAPPAFVSFDSALTLHDLTSRRLPRRLIVGPRSFAPLTLQGVELRWIRLRPDRLFGFETVLLDGQRVALASPERAIADALLVPRWADLDELARAIDRVSVRRLLAIVRRLGSMAAAKRAGWLLERTGHPVPDSFRRGLRRTTDPLMPRLPRKGPIDRRWGLLINAEPSDASGVV